MSKISLHKRDAAFASLFDLDPLFAKPDDFIEVTLWSNGEGFDAHLNSNGDQCFQLTWGQFKALKRLVKALDNA